MLIRETGDNLDYKSATEQSHLTPSSLQDRDNKVWHTFLSCFSKPDSPPPPDENCCPQARRQTPDPVKPKGHDSENFTLMPTNSCPPQPPSSHCLWDPPLQAIRELRSSEHELPVLAWFGYKHCTCLTQPGVSRLVLLCVRYVSQILKHLHYSKGNPHVRGCLPPPVPPGPWQPQISVLSLRIYLFWTFHINRTV